MFGRVLNITLARKFLVKVINEIICLTKRKDTKTLKWFACFSDSSHASTFTKRWLSHIPFIFWKNLFLIFKLYTSVPYNHISLKDNLKSFWSNKISTSSSINLICFDQEISTLLIRAPRLGTEINESKWKKRRKLDNTYLEASEAATGDVL